MIKEAGQRSLFILHFGIPMVSYLVLNPKDHMTNINYEAQRNEVSRMAYGERFEDAGRHIV
jgi:hypothetical protein